ncbi:MAG: hypothetical protein IT370_03630 [Deltaproteobacteria bacterium]|nr:hypothetical protein [Deltaproteobacteria bacterium]
MMTFIPTPIVETANRWTLALTLAARAAGRDFRGNALSGDAPAHLDPEQVGRAASNGGGAANDVSAEPAMPQAPTARGFWPFRRGWF